MTLNFDKISIKKYIGFIFILTFIVYGNSINNEYALDDNIVVDGNKTVAKGVKAIPEIFFSRYSTDSKQSYDYRPVVLASFAIEKQLFGKLTPFQTTEQKRKKDKITQANISHFINVLLYALLCVLIFFLLKTILPDYTILFPFLITIVFLIHPIHTEVVCSLKNRDELLMFVGVVSTILMFLKFAKTLQWKYLIYGVLWTVFAFLSKRNAMALIALVPIFLYYTHTKLKWIILAYFLMIILHVANNKMQNAILPDTDVRIFKYFENPLMFEDWSFKRVAASLYFSWFYFEMLLFPKDMSFYYGYNEVLLPDWGYWKVWLSLLFHGSLGVYGVYALIKRRIEGLAIVFWFGLLMGVNNIKFLLPGILADRFAFALSLGFCILLIWLIFKLFKVDLKQKFTKIRIPESLIAVLLAVTIIYSGRTIARNPDWHDYLHLYTTDVEHLENSAKVHALIANTIYPQTVKMIKTNPRDPKISSNVQKIIYHYSESVRIDSSYATSLNNLGSVYLNFVQDYDKAIKYCLQAIVYDTNYVEAYYNLAFSYKAKKEYDQSLNCCLKIIKIQPDYLKAYEIYNSILIPLNNQEKGIKELEKIALNSESPKSIYLNIANLYSSKGEGYYEESLSYFIKAYRYGNKDKVLCNHIINLSKRLGKNKITEEYSRLCN